MAHAHFVSMSVQEQSEDHVALIQESLFAAFDSRSKNPRVLHLVEVMNAGLFIASQNERVMSDLMSLEVNEAVRSITRANAADLVTDLANSRRSPLFWLHSSIDPKGRKQDLLAIEEFLRIAKTIQLSQI